MTSRSAISTMKKRFPGSTVFATINYRAYSHIPGVEKEYDVYAGNQKQAIARGKGVNWEDAISKIQMCGN